MSFNFVKYAVLPSLFLCNNVFSSETFHYAVVLNPEKKGEIRYEAPTKPAELINFAIALNNTTYENIHFVLNSSYIPEISIADKREEAVRTILRNAFPDVENKVWEALELTRKAQLAAVLCTLESVLEDENSQIFCKETFKYLEPSQYERAKLLLLSQCNYSTDFIPAEHADWYLINTAICLLQAENNGHKEKACELLEELKKLVNSPYEALLGK